MKLKRVLSLFIFGIFLISFVSADIVIMQNPDGPYSMGDVINLPIKVKTIVSLNDFFSLSLTKMNALINIAKNRKNNGIL